MTGDRVALVAVTVLCAAGCGHRPSLATIGSGSAGAALQYRRGSSGPGSDGGITVTYRTASGRSGSLFVPFEVDLCARGVHHPEHCAG